MKVVLSEMTPKGMTSHTYDIDGINKPIISVGRQQESDLKFLNNFVSRSHARIYKEKGQWVIEDLGSKYGMYHNGQRIKKKGLHNGVVITIPDDKGQIAAELRFEGETVPDHAKVAAEAIVSSNEKLQREVGMVGRVISDSNRVQRVAIEKEGYVEEETLYDAVVTKLALIPRGIVCFIFFIVAIVVGRNMDSAIGGAISDVLGISVKTNITGQFVLIALVIIIYFMAPSLILVFTTKLSYSNEEFHAQKQMFPAVPFLRAMTSRYNVPFDRIDNIEYDQGLVGRILGYGTVRCYAGSFIPYQIRFVKNGDDFVEKIRPEMDRYKRELISK